MMVFVRPFLGTARFAPRALTHRVRPILTRAYHQTTALRHSASQFQHNIDRELARTETPEFNRKVQTELEQAKKFIQSEAEKQKRKFVVLDIDETALDNREFYRDPEKIFYKAEDLAQDKSNFYKKWDLWVDQAKAPVIPAAKQFIQWLNEHSIPYCFVTGRIERQRDVTMKNLQEANLIGKSFKGLFCKPEGGSGNKTSEFKKRIVPELESQCNAKAIASIGDREADMMLPEAERNFKLSSSEFYPQRDKAEPR